MTQAKEYCVRVDVQGGCLAIRGDHQSGAAAGGSARERSSIIPTGARGRSPTPRGIGPTSAQET